MIGGHQPVTLFLHASLVLWKDKCSGDKLRLMYSYKCFQELTHSILSGEIRAECSSHHRTGQPSRHQRRALAWLLQTQAGTFFILK